MVVLGASFSALGALIFPYRETITRVGGFLIVGFGVMSVLGKGFSGVRLHDRPAATLAGTYLYGLTFAFGWTACVGPILGAILTTLVTSGLSVLAGATLAFIYALGLATPLALLATFFGRVGQGTRVGNILRGRGFNVAVAGRTLHLHTTSLISGVLLIAVGAMLATGQLTWLTRQWAGGVGGKIAWSVESWISNLFHLGWWERCFIETVLWHSYCSPRSWRTADMRPRRHHRATKSHQPLVCINIRAAHCNSTTLGGLSRSGRARSSGGQMRVVMLVVRVVTLFGFVAVALNACGSSQTTTPTTAVVGPALLFFYTDN
jgi:cytochrome c biogenesis protein CcdA